MEILTKLTKTLADQYMEVYVASPVLVILFWKLLEAIRKGWKY